MRWLSRVWFKLAGWKYAGRSPAARKVVVIGAPHTSNWDFVVFLAATSHFGLDAKAIGKHSLVQGPFGWLMRRLGIIPVRRDSGQGVVEQMVAAFGAAEEMALVIAPEGTRNAEPQWRSGFYRIALAAKVPLCVAALDAANKTVTLHDAIELSGDVGADMEEVRSLLKGSNGIRPEGASAIRLVDEAHR